MNRTAQIIRSETRHWHGVVAVCLLVLAASGEVAQAAAYAPLPRIASQPESTPSAPSRNGAWNQAIPAADTQAETNEAKTQAATNPIGVEASQHVIKPGDVVDVRVFQEEDLSGRSRVALDGTVTLPLLGQVKLGGLNLEEARNHVHKLLAEDYLVNPKVLVSLMEAAKARFTILGQVQQPGMYELPAGEQLGVLQAISLAGGYTRLANPSKITLRRTADGRETLIQFDGKALAKGRDPKSGPVVAGDTIYVPERIF